MAILVMGSGVIGGGLYSWWESQETNRGNFQTPRFADSIPQPTRNDRWKREAEERALEERLGCLEKRLAEAEGIVSYIQHYCSP